MDVYELINSAMNRSVNESKKIIREKSYKCAFTTNAGQLTTTATTKNKLNTIALIEYSELKNFCA